MITNFLARLFEKVSRVWRGPEEEAKAPARPDAPQERRSPMMDPSDAEFFNRRKDDGVGGES